VIFRSAVWFGTTARRPSARPAELSPDVVDDEAGDAEDEE